MKISFFDDEPEIYPLQYGGKARTIINLANEFIKHPDVEEVKILSRSIFSEKKEFVKNGVKYISLDDTNTMELIAKECQNVDIMNIHCCSFTFPFIKCKAKKLYFLHDVLIATADKGSHLDKSLGGDFDYVVAPSEFAKSKYDEKKKLFNRDVECLVIPRHIDQSLFDKVSSSDALNDEVPLLLKDVIKKYDEIIFFPNRPVEEKGGKYISLFAEEMKREKRNICIIGPFGEESNMPDNCINTGWIKSDKLKYFYSFSDVTFNFSTLPESFSQVCIESVYCGTPVVAFDSGNITNLSKMTKAILLCQKNLKSIIATTNKSLLLKKNEKKMEEERTKILNIFNKKKLINEYIDMYKKVLEESKNDKK